MWRPRIPILIGQVRCRSYRKRAVFTWLLLRQEPLHGGAGGQRDCCLRWKEARGNLSDDLLCEGVWTESSFCSRRTVGIIAQVMADGKKITAAKPKIGRRHGACNAAIFFVEMLFYEKALKAEHKP